MDRDEFAYLERSADERTRNWVERENKRTLTELEGDPRFSKYLEIALASEQVTEEPNSIGKIGPMTYAVNHDWVYQVLLDTKNPRGLLRRTSWTSYIARHPKWSSLIATADLPMPEARNWFLLYAYFSPDGRRCLLQFSQAGLDETRWREFDLERGTLVADGFNVSESSATNIAWRNNDTVIISTNFGPNSVNAANMPLVVKEWKRGQSLGDAREIFRGAADDLLTSVQEEDYISGEAVEEGGNVPALIVKWDRKQVQSWWELDSRGELTRLPLPQKLTGRPMIFRGQYLFMPSEDWSISGHHWKANSLLSLPVSEIHKSAPHIYPVMEATPGTSVVWWNRTQSGLLLAGSSADSGLVWKATFGPKGWKSEPIDIPRYGSVSPVMSSERSDTAFLKFSSFLHPTSVYRIDVRQKKIDVFQSNPAEFAADRFQVEARQAVSKDGVRVPYVLVMPKSRPKDGLTPVLVEGYGASGVPVESPEYSGTLGKLWLERGAAFAIADVRGGRGHAAGWWVRGAARRHTYEDMAAVVEDLIRTGITSPKRVGIKGHSSGGLLAAAMMTQRPDLFGAVVLEAALLDQFRMDLVMGGQGAFDMDFGSLAVDSERKFLERTSPFQNLNCSPALPKPFIITSATDQTVLPAQSRRFAAKLETGGCPFLFLETEEGGHSLALTPQERARLDALIYTYLARQLMDPAVPRTTRNELPTR